MKVQTSVAAAMAAAGVYAQDPSSTSTQTFTTTVYDDCPTPPLLTVTQGTTVTYCPECEASPSAYPMPPGYTTVYTTTYMSLCPTGMVPATYTVTESCTDATPTWSPGPTHIPDGFTVTVKQCDVCDTTPMAVTITEPCGCEATGGVPVTNGNPAPTAVVAPGSPPAAPSAACIDEQCGGSSSQSPQGSPAGSHACDGEECGGSGDQNPSMPGGAAPAAQPSPGGSEAKSTPAAQAPPYPVTSFVTTLSATGSLPGNNSSPGGSTIVTPYEGGASSSVHLGLVSSTVLAITIGILALIL